MPLSYAQKGGNQVFLKEALRSTISSRSPLTTLGTQIITNAIRIFMVQHQKQFQDSNIPKSYLTQIRGFSWHKNKINKIRSGHYSSNDHFQDSNKRKITENKTLGYLPRVLFFNAFELGAVVCKDAHVGAI
jgi:hypothetical protein